MLKQTLTLVTALLLGNSSAETHMQLILDASGSMYSKLPDGRSRITMAREVLMDFIARLPADPQLHVGLRLYGANTSATDAGACQDSQLVHPIQGLKRDLLSHTVMLTRPKGATPIAYTLEQAALDFVPGPFKNTIVLVTDGQESCGGNLKNAMEAFRKRGIEVDLRIIGIDLDARAQKSFQGIGTFQNARTTAELAAALGSAVVKVSPPVQQALKVTVKVLDRGKRVEDAKVSLSSVLDSAHVVQLQNSNGTHTGMLVAGTYQATVQRSGQTAQVFSGLGVVTGGENLFVLEVARPEPVLLTLDPSVPLAGGTVKVTFKEAPASEGQYLTLVPTSAPETEFGDSSPVKGVQGEATLPVPSEKVPLEVRFLMQDAAGSLRVLSRSASFIPRVPEVTLKAPDLAEGGGTVQVQWTGPDQEGDHLTVVPQDAPEGTVGEYQYTRTGKMLPLQVPMEEGMYEIRYMNDRTSTTQGRRLLQVKRAIYSLSALREVPSGSFFEVRWQGPGHPQEYITLVPVGTADGVYLTYAYTREGNPVRLQAPVQPGQYELRYSTDAQSPNPVLARTPLTVTSSQTYLLEAPRSAKAGSTLQVKWKGPGAPGEYVTVVKKGAPVGSYTTYFYVREGNPGTLVLPDEPGAYELRYSTEQDDPNPTLFSLPLTVLP